MSSSSLVSVCTGGTPAPYLLAVLATAHPNIGLFLPFSHPSLGGETYYLRKMSTS